MPRSILVTLWSLVPRAFAFGIAAAIIVSAACANNTNTCPTAAARLNAAQKLSTFSVALASSFWPCGIGLRAKALKFPARASCRRAVLQPQVCEDLTSTIFWRVIEKPLLEDMDDCATARRPIGRKPVPAGLAALAKASITCALLAPPSFVRPSGRHQRARRARPAYRAQSGNRLWCCWPPSTLGRRRRGARFRYRAGSFLGLPPAPL